MPSVRDLDDDTLLARLDGLARGERESIADVVEHLAEVHRRNLAVERAYPSLFDYCVERLGYSRAQAFFRSRAARAAQRHPRILELLRSGELHLEGLIRLHPYLEDPDAEGLLEEAKGKSQREIEAMVARFSPQPLPPESVRFIAVRKDPPPAPTFEGGLFSAPALDPVPDKAAAVESRVHLAFSAPVRFMTLLERARELSRHKFPEGRLEDILLDGLEALLDKRDPARRLLARVPRPRS